MKHGAEGTKTKRVSNVLDFAHCIRERVDEGEKQKFLTEVEIIQLIDHLLLLHSHK